MDREGRTARARAMLHAHAGALQARHGRGGFKLRGRSACACLRAQDVKHHVAQVERLAAHAVGLNIPSLVWVDANPITMGAHGAPALTCAYDVNAAAHRQAADLGFYMFSRQAMILSGRLVNEQGHYPAHQPDHVVKQQVGLALVLRSFHTVTKI